MKTTTLQLAVLTLAASILAMPEAGALEINKYPGLSPAEPITVNQAMTRGYLFRGLGSNARSKQGDRLGCGDTRIGTIQTPKTSRIDNTTVVRGDVINVSRNMRCK